MKSILQVCATAIFVTLVSRSGFAQVSPPGKTAALQAYEQGHYEDAEKLYLRAIDETKESKADTSNMAILLNNLAVLYVAEDRWTDASMALRQAVELCEKETSTANDLALAASFNKLGKAYQSHNKYTDAERLLKTALAIREQIVGPANSATATSLESLASLFFDEGKYAEAQTFWRRALTQSERSSWGQTTWNWRQLLMVLPRFTCIGASIPRAGPCINGRWGFAK